MPWRASFTAKGLAVSMPGKDVMTATTSDLAINPDFATMQLLQSGTLTTSNYGANDYRAYLFWPSGKPGYPIVQAYYQTSENMNGGVWFIPSYIVGSPSRLRQMTAIYKTKVIFYSEVQANIRYSLWSINI